MDFRELEPRAVVETRPIKGQLGKFTWHGEVSFYGKQYVVAPNATSYDAAKAAAEAIAAEIKASIILLGEAALKKFPLAKE